jgi:lipid-A-disaccharide synthase-like uncharacterized protein
MFHNMTFAELTWVVIGFSGQAVFGGRFIIQWLQSERAGKSVIPIPFWYMSIIGSIVLFIYAIHKRDPVFILGQGSGLFIYIRNLNLVNREKRNLALQNEFNQQTSAPIRK